MAVGDFRAIERSYFDLHWQLDPVAATQAGVAAHDGRYGRFSPDAIAPHLAALKAIASALEESTAADLDAEIDRTALLNEVRVTLRRFERLRPQATNPEFWLSHLLSGLHHLLVQHARQAGEEAVIELDQAVVHHVGHVQKTLRRRVGRLRQRVNLDLLHQLD